MNNNIFDELFVLELANNHWGSLSRGLKIIDEFTKIINKYNVRASIKLQFRDVEKFVHSGYLNVQERYIQKTINTKLSLQDFKIMVDKIKQNGLLTMATPFDESSVDLCDKLNLDIIKIASSDIDDWLLINKVAETRRPVIISTGGATIESIDKIVNFFNSQNIPLAINHCVSLYPTNPEDMDIGQVSFFKKRYPNNVIGFSTHEFNDTLSISTAIATSLGARTFERHIDIENTVHQVTPYCSLPKDIDVMISSYLLSKKMKGEDQERRKISSSERQYLDALLRGVYLKRDVNEGELLTFEDVYFAIPLQKGQISCNEFNQSERVTVSIQKDSPLLISKITSSYKNESLENEIERRGL